MLRNLSSFYTHNSNNNNRLSYNKFKVGATNETILQSGIKIEVACNAVVQDGGKGLCKVKDGKGGPVVFVENALPGEVLLAQITRSKKRYAEGVKIESIHPPDESEIPKCEHFSGCGGCVFQNISYKQELSIKQQLVVDAFVRIGQVQNVEQSMQEIIGCQKQYQYRNKVQLLVGEHDIDKRCAVGFYQKSGILEINKCWLQDDVMNEIMNLVQELLVRYNISAYSQKQNKGMLRSIVIRKSEAMSNYMLQFVLADDYHDAFKPIADLLQKKITSLVSVVSGIQYGKEVNVTPKSVKVYNGQSWLEDILGEKKFRISSTSFFQVNTRQAQVLVDIVRRRIMQCWKGGGKLLDLYCGIGVFAIVLQDLFEQVVGIDYIESSIIDAQENALINNCSNTQFLHGDVSALLKEDSLQNPDVVLADPSRHGMNQKVLKFLLKAKPKMIIYVSCNPSTQARDLKLLLAENDYAIDLVQPIDLFPQTAHVENIAFLVKT